MPKAMLITVGTGRNHADIANAIARSIEIQNPDLIFFLATSGSSETVDCVLKVLEPDKKYKVIECYSENAVDCVLKVLGPNVKYKVIEHKFENEVNKLYEIYDWVFSILTKEGFGRDNIVIDFTSGTKPMSAALFAVGIAREVKNICYISGERDHQGRVIPGTEKTEVPSLTPLYLRIKLGRLPELFSTYQFEACLRLIREFKGKTGVLDHLNKLGFLEDLVMGYMHWDRFQLSEAFEKLSDVKKHRGDYVKRVGIKEALERHVDILCIECGKRGDLAEKTKHGRYCDERLIDLYANAKRRFEEGKYDDATSRVYRAFEYLAQLSLYKECGIESGDLKIESLMGRLPEERIGEYEERRRRSRYEGKLQLGLVECYELLKDLNNTIGIKFINEYSDKGSPLFKYYSLRNNSINAHGFEPVGREGCEGFIGVFENYLNDYIPRWRETYRKMKFPQLPGADFWSG